jgi:hypothetical protein
VREHSNVRQIGLTTSICGSRVNHSAVALWPFHQPSIRLQKNATRILLCDHPVVVPPIVCRRRRFPCLESACSLCQAALARNQSQVAGHLFSARKAADVAEGSAQRPGHTRLDPSRRSLRLVFRGFPARRHPTRQSAGP